jgi:hypothetical protein
MEGGDVAGLFVGSFVFEACATTTGATFWMMFVSVGMSTGPRIVTRIDSPGARTNVAFPSDGSVMAGFGGRFGSTKVGLTTLATGMLRCCSKRTQFSEAGFAYGLLMMSWSGVAGADPASCTRYVAAVLPVFVTV